MKDIVERLRRRTFRPVADVAQAFNEQGNLTHGDAALHEEAAAEIEVLRNALQQDIDYHCTLKCAKCGHKNYFTLRELNSSQPDVDAGLTPLESLRYWINAYSDPASGDHFMGHGRVVHLLREYLALREQQAG